jgi:hypothetical protein
MHGQEMLIVGNDGRCLPGNPADRNLSSSGSSVTAGVSSGVMFSAKSRTFQIRSRASLGRTALGFGDALAESWSWRIEKIEKLCYTFFALADSPMKQVFWRTRPFPGFQKPRCEACTMSQSWAEE